MQAFPVDTRSDPVFNDEFSSTHRGTDIFAPAGTPVLAVDNGNVRAAQESRGGNAVYLRATDGVSYYYAHLQEYVGVYPRAVRAGEIIGTVGTSGNAEGTAPHVHFEIRSNGIVYNPFSELSRLQNRGIQGRGGLLAPLLIVGAAVALFWGTLRRRI